MVKRLTKIFIIFITIYLLLFNNYSYALSNNIESKRLTIAIVPKSLDNPIFLDTLEAAQRKADELNINLEWVAPFTTETDEQIKIINSLIKRKVDGIIISANDPLALKKVINKAIDKGIAVATFDSDVPGSKRLFYIGSDNVKAGLAIGHALVDIINRSGSKDDVFETVILTGARKALNLNERILGFEKATYGRVKIKVMDILYCNDDFQLAIELVENYIKKNQETDVVFFVGGWPFYVPSDAMPYFQQWAKEGGIALGIDIFYSALVLQKEGLIDYLVGQDFFAMGSRSLELMVNYLRYNKKPPEFIETGLTYADSKNLDKLLKIYKPWGVR